MSQAQHRIEDMVEVKIINASLPNELVFQISKSHLTDIYTFPTLCKSAHTARRTYSDGHRKDTES